MECVELALKSSFRKKMSVNLSPQLRWDELGSFALQNAVSCDDFSVEELLNFSDEDGFEGQENGKKEEGAAEGDENEDHKGLACVSVSPQELEESENPNESFSVTDGFGSLPTSELSVPTDDLADLEWLSHFVDDSFSDYSAPFLAGIWIGKPKQVEVERETKAFTPPPPCFKTPIPARPRSKRARTGGRVWVLGSSSVTESSSTSTTSSSSSSSPSSPLLSYNPVVPFPGETVSRYEKPPAKKPKKRSPPVNGNYVTGTTQTTRRCSHCGVQKTPQWRAGPLGAKTLCNACGVRYKSGRLLPEYRPACSPTFSSELHSNHHRKVLEMRRKKDDPGLPEPGSTSILELEAEERERERSEPGSDLVIM